MEGERERPSGREEGENGSRQSRDGGCRWERGERRDERKERAVGEDAQKTNASTTATRISKRGLVGRIVVVVVIRRGCAASLNTEERL